jgi:hypothetical protein
VSPLVKPPLPDVVIQFQGQAGPRVLPGAADTVAIPVIHDWGPVGTDPGGATGTDGGIQELLSFDEWTSLFGDSATPGRTAVAGAFAGPGMPGVVGAGAVVVFRMATASVAAAAATITGQLQITAYYKGSRGNRISFVVDTDPGNAANDRLRIFLDGGVRETYSYGQTAITTLVAQVTAASSLVKVTNLETGAPVRLTANPGGTPISLTGGNDGAVVVAQNHLNAMHALEQKSHLFALLAPYDVTDAAIQASYTSWAQAQEAASRPTRVVLGGAAAEVYSDAQTRALACNDEHVITLGIGTWHDDLLGADLSTSQLAPRIAGILAMKGQTQALTSTHVGGIHPVGTTAPSFTDAVNARNNGVVCFVPADSADADVKLQMGVTTYTVQTNPEKPYDVFSDARLVGIMDNYVRDMREWGNEQVIGSLPVNDDTRNTVYGQARALQDDLLAAGLILPGDDVTVPIPWVTVQNTDTDAALNDTIPYSFGWQFARTANAIIGQGTVL